MNTKLKLANTNEHKVVYKTDVKDKERDMEAALTDHSNCTTLSETGNEFTCFRYNTVFF